MAKEERALVNQDGSLVEIQIVETSKIAENQSWPKYVHVIREVTPPTLFHQRAGETAQFLNGNWVITATWLNPNLSTVKASLRHQVDHLAEKLRLQFITPGDGQAMTYEAKRTEARRWALAGEPNNPAEEEYPFAAARAVRKSVSIAEVLSEWKGTSAAWANVAVAIEDIREGSKEAIAVASDVESACQIFEGIDWSVE